MKKILMVVSTLNHGGAQKVFANLTLAFPEEWQIDILLNNAENITYPYRGRILSLQIDNPDDKTGILYQARVFLRRYRKLKELKKKNHYDACLSALTSANAVNVLTGRRYCKTILTVHSFMTRDMGQLGGLKQIIIAMAIKLLYNRADRVVTVSEGSRNDLVQKFGVDPRKAITIYNGFPIKDIINRSKEQPDGRECTFVEDSGFKFVTAGRLDGAKGQWHLIRAFRSVAEAFPDAKLLILGEGILEQSLKKTVKECGLENNVVFGGFVENPYKIMAKCDAFVMSSLYEGFPGVLIEALACGLPCISTDFDSGAREILAPGADIAEKVTGNWQKEQYGILCPVCDGQRRRGGEKLTKEEKILADAMLALVRESALRDRYQKRSQERAWQLDAENFLGKWLEII